MAYCKVWYCTSPGHWVKAKALKWASAPNHWQTAKGIWYRQTTTWARHCAFVKPTIGKPANISVNIGAVATFHTTASNYDTLKWQWAAKTGTTWHDINDHDLTHATGKAITVHQGYRYRLVGINAWGTTIGQPGVLTVKAPLPKIQSVLSDNYMATNGVLPAFLITASGFTRIEWYTKASATTGAWTKATLGQSLNRGQLFLLSLSGRTVSAMHHMLIKARLYNSTGQYIESRTAAVYTESTIQIAKFTRSQKRIELHFNNNYTFGRITGTNMEMYKNGVKMHATFKKTGGTSNAMWITMTTHEDVTSGKFVLYIHQGVLTFAGASHAFAGTMMLRVY